MGRQTRSGKEWDESALKTTGNPRVWLQGTSDSDVWLKDGTSDSDVWLKDGTSDSDVWLKDGTRFQWSIVLFSSACKFLVFIWTIQYGVGMELVLYTTSVELSVWFPYSLWIIFCFILMKGNPSYGASREGLQTERVLQSLLLNLSIHAILLSVYSSW